MTPAVRIEVLARHHDRRGFSCGVDALDRYFHEQATQDVKRRAAACYVGIDGASGEIAGYYTLAAGGIPLVEMPEELAKKLPRYSSVPVARLGRLAVGTRFVGRRIGGMLLSDAALRSARSGMGVFALVVDAKDERAAAFYRHHGFDEFGDSPLKLLLSLTRFPVPE